MTSDRIEQPTPVEESLEQHEALSPLQEHFLQRLASLAEMRREYLLKGEKDPLESKLLSRTLYATLMDCVNVGVGDQGHALLEGKRIKGW